MKRIMAFMAAVLVAVAAQAQSQAADEPQFAEDFKPVERVHDFGTVYEKNGKVSNTFEFKNTGTKPVVISDISVWCGCTTADYTKQPIRPGSTGRVTVTYNPAHRPGTFSKEVVVLIDGGKRYSRVWVKGNVVGYLHPVKEDHPYYLGEGLWVSHEILAFPPLKKGEQSGILFRVANDTDKPMTVDFVRKPGNRVLQLPKQLKLKPKERTRLVVRYKAPAEYAYRRFIMVTPVVNGKAVKPVKVSWMATSGGKKFELHTP